jgi:hypothetical protein
MRLNCNSRIPYLKTSYKSFDSISKIFINAHCKRNAKVTFNLDRVSQNDANLSSVCAAVSFMLEKSQNTLDIGPRKFGYNKVRFSKDLLGYHCTSAAFLGLTYWTGGTPVHIFDQEDEAGFSDYLLHSAFRKDWKSDIPVHYKIRIKEFLKELFKNAVDHRDNKEPIFISSSFKDGYIKFTIADCGRGFLKQISKVDKKVIGDREAISWALKGKSIKGLDRSNTLKCLGDYCLGNGGSLIVLSGNYSVKYGRHQEHEYNQLSAPFRGSIINLSIKIHKQKMFVKD